MTRKHDFLEGRRAAGCPENRMMTTADIAARTMTRVQVSCILAALSCGIGTPACAQRNSVMLPTYRGWGIGISLDSANKLAVRDTKEGLICVGEETREMFCKSEEAVPNVMTVNAYFTPSPRRLDEVMLIQLRDRPMALDSIFAPFIRGWGKYSRHDDSTVSSTSPTGKHSARRQTSAEWKFPGVTAGVSVQEIFDRPFVGVSISSNRFSAQRLRWSRKEMLMGPNTVIVH